MSFKLIATRIMLCLWLCVFVYTQILFYCVVVANIQVNCIMFMCVYITNGLNVIDISAHHHQYHHHHTNNLPFPFFWQLLLLFLFSLTILFSSMCAMSFTWFHCKPNIRIEHFCYCCCCCRCQFFLFFPVALKYGVWRPKIRNTLFFKYKLYNVSCAYVVLACSDVERSIQTGCYGAMCDI